MSYNSTQFQTWSRASLADGNNFQYEFAQIYANFAYVLASVLANQTVGMGANQIPTLGSDAKLHADVVGNATGSSGSCTGNSATATNSAQLGGMTTAQLILACHPIGESYTQHYGDPLPSTLYGGTWTIRFNTEAIVEMTESSGGATWEAETFDASVKDSQRQGYGIAVKDSISSQTHYHNSADAGMGTYLSAPENIAATVRTVTGMCVNDGTNGTPRVGLATKPRRRIVRKFTRTA